MHPTASIYHAFLRGHQKRLQKLMDLTTKAAVSEAVSSSTNQATLDITRRVGEMAVRMNEAAMEDSDDREEEEEEVEGVSDVDD